MRKRINKVVLVTVFCISMLVFSGCSDEGSSNEPEENVATELEDELMTQVEDMDLNIEDVEDVEGDLSNIYDESIDIVYGKVEKEFEEGYYDKLIDVLKEKGDSISDEANFDDTYEEVFKSVFEEFYGNFKKDTTNYIYLEDEVYTSIYNKLKEKYYNDFKKQFVIKG